MVDSDSDYVYNSAAEELQHDSEPASSNELLAPRSIDKSQDVKNGKKGRLRKDQRNKAKWEQVTRSWEAVETDENGGIETSILQVKDLEKRMRILRDTTPLQRGIIRHLILVLDMSFAMAEKDLPPTRFKLMMRYAQLFVAEFFEQNPISQLGIVGMIDGKAVTVSEVSGNIEQHVAALSKWKDEDPSGNPSLQNALELCRAILYQAPSHSTREVLVIFGALMTIDPADIHITIDNLVKECIRTSVIGIDAQVAICQYLCRHTNGGDDSLYSVATNKEHFENLFLSATTPPVARVREHASPNLLQMGFPSRIVDNPDKAVALCACHGNAVRKGYKCTGCGAKLCRLPAECPSCSLTLILSTHLARSYHHLFPLKTWRQVLWTEAVKSSACFSCHHPFPTNPLVGGADRRRHNQSTKKKRNSSDLMFGVDQTSMSAPDKPQKLIVSESGRYACPDCGHHFCIDCDVFCHETIYNCPGCQSCL